MASSRAPFRFGATRGYLIFAGMSRAETREDKPLQSPLLPARLVRNDAPTRAPLWDFLTLPCACAGELRRSP
jgi:hypothetical protein